MRLYCLACKEAQPNNLGERCLCGSLRFTSKVPAKVTVGIIETPLPSGWPFKATFPNPLSSQDRKFILDLMTCVLDSCVNDKAARREWEEPAKESSNG